MSNTKEQPPKKDNKSSKIEDLLAKEELVSLHCSMF